MNLMGLLEDKDALMTLAASLLSARKGQEGAALGQGLLGAMQAKRQNEGLALDKQGKEQSLLMGKMQLDQMRRAGEQQSAIQSLGQRAFAPPQQLDPRQQEGGQESIPGGGGLPEYARGLMQLDPQKGLAMQAQLAQLAQKERVKVDPGQTIGTYQGGKFVPDFSAPDKPPSGFTRGPNGLVADPSWLEAQQKIRAAGRPQVNVDTRQETEFAKALGKQQGEDYSKLMNSDAAASGTLNKLSRLESLFKASGNTGKLTPPTMELKAIADSLGFKVDPKLPYQQAAQALSNEIALEMRNPSGGAGMPGALSDRDREFLQNMVPNLAKTPEGNKLLIESKKRLAMRDKEVAKLAREYKAKTGRFDEGFYQVLSDFSEKHPLFPEMPQKDPIDDLVNKYRTR